MSPVSFALILILLTVGAPAQKQPAAAEPAILSPADKQHIGVADDPLCEREKPCNRIRAEGRVPTSATPFFAVEPVAISPKMFIQPHIHRTKRDGTFSGLVYLGEMHNGPKQWFKIYLFACANPNRFHEADEIVKLPDDCAVSDPVEVFRER